MKLSTLIDIAAAEVLPATGKAPKASAGYVHRSGSDYRCSECRKFLPERQRCTTFGPDDVVHPNGYCIYWELGPSAGVEPSSAYTPLEAGYGEAPNGTRCVRCMFFRAGRCQKVDEASPGDDPGEIHPEACCNFQQPLIGG